MIYALDPGPERSALVVLDGTRVVTYALDSNGVLLATFRRLPAQPLSNVLVIEQVESFGMAVGREVFDTVFWAGRFAEAWPGHWERLPRSAVKLAICHSRRARDSEIRQALLDRYGPGREKAVGTKANPGPLFGLKADLWAALALGLAYQEQPVCVSPSSPSSC